MKKNFFNFLSKSFLIFFISFTSLYPQYDMWQEKNESDIVEVGQRYIIPKAYKIYQLNINALTNLLSDVPMEFTADATRRAKIIYIPMPDGSFQRFRFVE
ncbi:MAG: hypothetical protein N2043_08535, partial [Ignavibacterium sp.]|nr:hypothetical protein [Ignavibacterium sp.]